MKQVIKNHIDYRHQIIYLIWLDFTRRYRGAILSWAWSIIRPAILLLVYWFVLKFGLNVSSRKEGVDLFPWLATGVVVWFYCAGILNSSTSALRNYKHIITKMNFPATLIPIIVTLSGLITHLVLLVMVIGYLLVFTDLLAVQWIQLPIYIVLMALFFMGWSMLAAPVAALSKDFAQFIKSITRILFWVSGILWNVHNIDVGWLRRVMLFNPITFFAEGYRNSLLYREWMWEEPESLIGFGVILVAVLLLGLIVQKRTRKEIVDVL